MTRETKIGMLVGMGVIVGAAILISNYLASSTRAPGADMSELTTDPAHFESIRTQPPVAMRVDPLPNPDRSAPPRAASAGQADPTPTPPVVADRTERPIIPLYGRGTVGRQPSTGGTPPATGDAGFQPDRMVTGRPPALANRRTDAGDIVHYVVEGDNLIKLARRYYGDGDYAQIIYEANRDKMNSPSALRIGVRLVIPNRAGQVVATPPTPPAPAAGAAAPARPATYVMREGDTLSEVAERVLGSTARWHELYRLNKDRIRNPDRVPIGTELRLPAH